jgi:hypothetical protein
MLTISASYANFATRPAHREEMCSRAGVVHSSFIQLGGRSENLRSRRPNRLRPDDSGGGPLLHSPGKRSELHQASRWVCESISTHLPENHGAAMMNQATVVGGAGRGCAGLAFEAGLGGHGLAIDAQPVAAGDLQDDGPGPGYERIASTARAHRLRTSRSRSGLQKITQWPASCSGASLTPPAHHTTSADGEWRSTVVSINCSVIAWVGPSTLRQCCRVSTPRVRGGFPSGRGRKCYHTSHPLRFRPVRDRKDEPRHGRHHSKSG